MWHYCIKMEFPKIADFLNTTSDDKDLQKDLLLKNGLKSMINQENMTMLIKKLQLKRQCYDQIYVIILMHILFKRNYYCFKTKHC